MINTVLQIAVFISALAIIVLCVLQSNKGQSVLNGLSNSGNLFKNVKDVGYDKTITRIIIILIALFFILSAIEGLI